MKRSTYCAKVCFPKRQQLSIAFKRASRLTVPSAEKVDVWLAQHYPAVHCCRERVGCYLISPSECNRAWPARFQEVKLVRSKFRDSVDH